MGFGNICYGCHLCNNISNLKNPTFLRNLTKAQAKESILHGVQGTPMPPWGKSALTGKEGSLPVLSEDEVERLVNWLFNALPGSETYKENEVERWNYTPNEVIEELDKSGLNLSMKNIKDTFNTLGNAYVAELNSSSTIDIQASGLKVESIFDQDPPLEGSSNRPSYYIKRSLYNKENIAKGKELFIENCSHCHGKEAQGDGARAEFILDAK